VASGSTLSLSNSSITWSGTAADHQQYAIYAQSGAGAITLTSNIFTFNSTNIGGAYSYLIGTQGDLVANYPVLTMSGNTENAYMQFLLYGADTAVHKTAWAATYVTATIHHNRIGMTGGVSAEAGIYTRSASGWSKNINVADETQLRAAVLVANAIITVTAATSIVIADTNLVISNNVTIKGNGKTLSGKGIEITCKLSEEIGLVGDLNVSTDDDKISEVKFSNSESTNMSALEKVINNLEEAQLDKNVFNGKLNENLVVKMYNTKNENVYLSVLQDKNKRLKNGQPRYEFRYIHKEAAIKNYNLLMKRIGKSHNKKLPQ
jgi:hypothetical protein